ncbi:hypothetical protein, partial [Desulfovibrio piger]|uniref:hypothetical protein n=1 Tax=Desulfovibrio piger TaxID=901 RepID=UPI0026F2260E
RIVSTRIAGGFLFRACQALNRLKPITKNARNTNLRAFLCTETVQREAPHGPPGGHFRAEEVNPEISCVHGLAARRTA